MSGLFMDDIADRWNVKEQIARDTCGINPMKFGFFHVRIF